MKYLLVSAAFAASALVPTAAMAQAVPGAIVVVVDSNRAANECNACKTAAASLRSQAQSFDTRRTTLNNQLGPERKAIQTAVDAPGSKQPDAALQTRIKAFQTKAQAAEQELAATQQRLQSVNVNILKQIKEKLDPAVQTVMTRRGANLAIETDNTLAHGASLDVTNEVIAQLNATLSSVSATPMPQQTTAPSR